MVILVERQSRPEITDHWSQILSSESRLGGISIARVANRSHSAFKRVFQQAGGIGVGRTGAVTEWLVRLSAKEVLTKNKVSE